MNREQLIAAMRALVNDAEQSEDLEVRMVSSSLDFILDALEMGERIERTAGVTLAVDDDRCERTITIKTSKKEDRP